MFCGSYGGHDATICRSDRKGVGLLFGDCVSDRPFDVISPRFARIDAQSERLALEKPSADCR